MESLLYGLSPVQAQGLYALGWLSFGVLHSLLAGAGAKDRLMGLFGANYRLCYNLFAVVHIGAVFMLGQAALGGSPAFPLEAGVEGALKGVSVLGWVVLVLALREYDLGQFSGLSQIRAHRRGAPEPEDEPLVTAGLHRFVRHPIYLGAHMILWGGAVDGFGLATAAWGSAYLVIGARFEEKKLVRLYGGEYRDYQDRVPAVIPWKVLGKGRA